MRSPSNTFLSIILLSVVATMGLVGYTEIFADDGPDLATGDPASSTLAPITEPTDPTGTTEATTKVTQVPTSEPLAPTIQAPTAGPGLTNPDVDVAASDNLEVREPGQYTQSQITVIFAVESQVADVSVDLLADTVLKALSNPDGWSQAGFTFKVDQSSQLRVVLAEPDVVDSLCLPYRTSGQYSCQNGSIVALNADRWRRGVAHWTSGLDMYRNYLINHEVGHLIGQNHPVNRCPVEGRPAAVMEQQTIGLNGCVENVIPRSWEIDYARTRPVYIGPPDGVQQERPNLEAEIAPATSDLSEDE